MTLFFFFSITTFEDEGMAPPSSQSGTARFNVCICEWLKPLMGEIDRAAGVQESRHTAATSKTRFCCASTVTLGVRCAFAPPQSKKRGKMFFFFSLYLSPSLSLSVTPAYYYEKLVDDARSREKGEKNLCPFCRETSTQRMRPATTEYKKRKVDQNAR